MSSNVPTPSTLSDDGISVSITHLPLDPSTTLSKVKSPKAGALVLFAGFPVPLLSPPPSYPFIPPLLPIPPLGTTRDNFSGKPVLRLSYSSYIPLALKTLLAIARELKLKHSLTAIAFVHRVGVVPIGDESIVIAVSAPHRTAAWRAGEEALEECKARVEVWKQEVYAEDGEEGARAVWRANCDDGYGYPVDGYPGTGGDEEGG